MSALAVESMVEGQREDAGEPAGAAPALATVIVSLNTRELLRRCLETVLAGTRTPNAVWVVDNGSTDGSAELVRAEFPGVNLIVSPENLGFAAANNVVLRRLAGPRYALLLNPDTEVPAGTLDALVEYMDAHPRVGAAGVQLLNPDGTQQYCYDRFYDFFGSFRRNILVERLLDRRRGVSGAAQEARPVDWIIGACLILRLEALHTAGFLDEIFYMYGEEQDLQWRLHRAGWAVHLLPWLTITHHGGQSAKQAPVKNMLQDYRARYLTVRRQTNRPTAAAYLAKALAALACWSLYWSLRGRAGDAGAAGRAAAYRAVLAAHCRPGFYTPHRAAAIST